MTPTREQLVVCETPAAIVLHLREVGASKINYSGNDGKTETLCGAGVGWDTREQVQYATCSTCLNIVADRGKGK